MQMVRLLLPIGQDGTTEACAEAGSLIARAFGAEAEILHACPPSWQRLPYSNEIGVVYYEQLIDIAREQVAMEKQRAHRWFKKIAKQFGEPKPVFHSADGTVSRVVAAHAWSADLSILPQEEAAEDLVWAEARDGAIFYSGRPVLVVPSGARFRFETPVLIAWKEGPQAVRAIAAAAPKATAAMHHAGCDSGGLRCCCESCNF